MANESKLQKNFRLNMDVDLIELPLFRMVQFSKFFPDQEIVVTLLQQLSWSHFVEITAIFGNLKRSYYLEICCIERWNVRVLRSEVNTVLYERTALARKTAEFNKAKCRKVAGRKYVNT